MFEQICFQRNNMNNTAGKTADEDVWINQEIKYAHNYNSSLNEYFIYLYIKQYLNSTVNFRRFSSKMRFELEYQHRLFLGCSHKSEYFDNSEIFLVL